MSGCCFGNSRCAGTDGRVAKFTSDDLSVLERGVREGSFLLLNCQALHAALPGDIGLAKLASILGHWRKLRAQLNEPLRGRIEDAKDRRKRANAKIYALQLELSPVERQRDDAQYQPQATAAPRGGVLPPLDYTDRLRLELRQQQKRVDRADQIIRDAEDELNAIANANDHDELLRLAADHEVERQRAGPQQPTAPQKPRNQASSNARSGRYKQAIAATQRGTVVDAILENLGPVKQAIGDLALMECLKAYPRDTPSQDELQHVLEQIDEALDHYQCRDCGTCMLCHASPNKYVLGNKLLGFAFREVDATETWGLKYPVRREENSQRWVRLDANLFRDKWANGPSRVPADICWNWFYRMQRNVVDENFNDALRAMRHRPLQPGSALRKHGEFPARWLLENINERGAHNCDPASRLLCLRCASLIKMLEPPAQPSVSIERIDPPEQQQAGQTATVHVRFDGPIFSPRAEHLGIAGAHYPAANVEIFAPEFDVDTERLMVRVDDAAEQAVSEPHTARFRITSETACAGLIKLRDPRWCSLGESISLPYRFVAAEQALPVVTFAPEKGWNNKGASIPVYDKDQGEEVGFRICRLGGSGSAISGKLRCEAFPAPIPFEFPAGRGDRDVDVSLPSSAELKLRKGETESTWPVELQLDDQTLCRLSETVRAIRVIRSPAVLPCGLPEQEIKSKPCNLKLLRVTELHSGQPPKEIHPGSNRTGIFVVRNEQAVAADELGYDPDRPKEPPLIQVTAGSADMVKDSNQGQYHQTHLKIELEGEFCAKHPKLRVVEIAPDGTEDPLADSKALDWSSDIFRAEQRWDDEGSIAEKSIKEFFKYIYRNRDDLDPLLEDLESVLAVLAAKAQDLAEDGLREAEKAARAAEQAVEDALSAARDAAVAAARQAAEAAQAAARAAQQAAEAAADAARQLANSAADRAREAAAEAARAAQAAAEAAKRAAAAARAAAEKAAAVAREVADEAVAAASRTAAAAADAAQAAAAAAINAAGAAAEAALALAINGAQPIVDALNAAAEAAQQAAQAAWETALAVVDAAAAATEAVAKVADAAIRNAAELARQVAKAAKRVARQAEALAKRIAAEVKALGRGIADEVRRRYRQAIDQAQKIASKAKEIADKARKLAEQVAAAAEKLANALVDAAQELARQVAGAAQDAASAALEAAHEVAAKLARLLQQAAKFARDAAASAARAAQACAEFLASLASTALGLINTLLQGIEPHAPGLPRGDMPRSPKSMRLKQYRIVAECCGTDCDSADAETRALGAMIQVFPSDEFVLHFDGPELTPFEIAKDGRAASSEDDTIGFDDDPSRTQNLSIRIDDLYTTARAGGESNDRSRSFQGTNQLERAPFKNEETDSLLGKMYRGAKSLFPSTTGEVMLLHNGNKNGLHGQALAVAESMVKVLQSTWAVQDVWNGLQGLMPTVGWGFEVGIAIMEGELDWQWGFKEFDDHRVFYWEEAGTELTVARIYFRLYIGPRLRILFVKFECVLYGLITLDFGYTASWEVKGPKQVTRPTESAPSDYPDEATTTRLVNGIRQKAEQAVETVEAAKGTVKQALGMAVEVEVEQPDTAGASERGSFEKSGDGSWYQAATRAELGANLVLIHENILQCNAAVKTGYKIRARRLEEHPGMEAETYFIGLSFVATASCKLFKEKRKIVPILAGDPLGSPRSRMVVPREPGAAWDDIRKQLARVAAERDRREDFLTAAVHDWDETRIELIATTTGFHVDESSLLKDGPGRYWDRLKSTFEQETGSTRRGRLRPKHPVKVKLQEHAQKADQAFLRVREMLDELQALVPSLDEQAKTLSEAEYELAGKTRKEIAPRQKELRDTIAEIEKEVKAINAKTEAARLTSAASDLRVWARLRTVTVAVEASDDQIEALLPDDERELVPHPPPRDQMRRYKVVPPMKGGDRNG
ncbi:hypothetical protein [Piscinibacter sakaiensis]|uniref:hypothetical protein n=1 Tax=Piscinibacter sakaiensis TaxID=1547922 RepID=UPI003AAC7933